MSYSSSRQTGSSPASAHGGTYSSTASVVVASLEPEEEGSWPPMPSIVQFSSGSRGSSRLHLSDASVRLRRMVTESMAVSQEAAFPGMSGVPFGAQMPSKISPTEWRMPAAHGVSRGSAC